MHNRFLLVKDRHVQEEVEAGSSSGVDNKAFDCSETESLPDQNEEVFSKSPEIDPSTASGTLMKTKPSVPSPDLESALQATPGHKTVRAWFKDPQLYKESIAYLPLVMLVGATVSTGITRKIIEKIGSKRSFILAGLVVIGSCVWFYFITQSTRVLTYPAAALLGFGFSAMFVNALSFATELIGDNKEPWSARVIQNFFPEESDASEDCEECGDYVRLVFSIVPGLLAVISLLIVLMFDTSHNTTKRNGLKSDVATQTDASEEVS
ncbi:hypothetical protein ACROYT_G005470 [Oculina patagonica]